MSLPHWAVPGAEVVCIGGISHDHVSPGTNGMPIWRGELPEKGKTYRISKTEDHPRWPAISLVGYPWYVGFWVGFFRPAVKQEDDVAMFREIADTAKQREREPA